jgi:SAM-dependent methyltransferase
MGQLRDHQDAYGHALYDCHLGKSAYEIDERDDGYVGVCDVQEYFAAYGAWPERQREALRDARGRVLDVGCGAGRHALYLQQEGFEVLGIDTSPLAIEVCRLRGLREARVASVTQVSRKLGRFDTIVMLGNNFGLLADPRRGRWLLQRFRTVTGAGARIIAETVDPYRTEEAGHLAYHELNRKRGRMAGQIRLRVRYKTYATPWFDYLFVSQDEMRGLLGDTGWRVERFVDADPGGYIAVICAGA